MDKIIERYFTKYISEFLGRPIRVTVEMIRLDSRIITRPNYQREIRESNLKFIEENFNVLAAGFISLNIRPDGKIVLMDGAHRVKGGKANGHDAMPALISHGLTN